MVVVVRGRIARGQRGSSPVVHVASMLLRRPHPFHQLTVFVTGGVLDQQEVQLGQDRHQQPPGSCEDGAKGAKPTHEVPISHPGTGDVVIAFALARRQAGRASDKARVGKSNTNRFMTRSNIGQKRRVARQRPEHPEWAESPGTGAQR